MKKIISLFVRDFAGDPSRVLSEVTPGAEWVIDGFGIATEKFDGTACMVRDGVLYKRYDAKNGKTPPPGFEPAQEPDSVTGHWPGWVPVSDENPQDKWHREALFNWLEHRGPLYHGTYELVGPKVQGNPYSMVEHWLVRHGSIRLDDAPRDFDGLAVYLRDRRPRIEGIVWHHEDGRMVKIKAKDFGIRWPK